MNDILHAISKNLDQKLELELDHDLTRSLWQILDQDLDIVFKQIIIL